MEDSILTSVKAILGIAAETTTFDLDIATHINAAFSTMYQLGYGENAVFLVQDASQKWSELGMTENALGLARTYVYLKVRMLFDPPSTSYQIDAFTQQIRELEWRLNTIKEVEDGPSPDVSPTPWSEGAEVGCEERF